MAALAGAYGKRLIPHLWLLAVLIPVQKVLQAQGVMAPMGAVAACLLAFHVPVTLALVRRFGYLGAAHATCLTDALALLLTAGYDGRVCLWDLAAATAAAAAGDGGGGAGQHERRL